MMHFNSYECFVTRVIDGDTFVGDVPKVWGKLRVEGETFRLLGIQCPETKGSSKEAGLVSKEYVKQRIEGKTIRITTHGSGGFGRTLVTVYVKDSDGEVNLNTELLKRGLAVPYVR